MTNPGFIVSVDQTHASVNNTVNSWLCRWMLSWCRI